MSSPLSISISLKQRPLKTPSNLEERKSQERKGKKPSSEGIRKKKFLHIVMIKTSPRLNLELKQKNLRTTTKAESAKTKKKK